MRSQDSFWNLPRGRQIRGFRNVVLWAIVPPVGFWLAGQKASVIVSVLAAFLAAGMLALGDVGSAVVFWGLVCLWAAFEGLGTAWDGLEASGQDIWAEEGSPPLLRTDSIGMVALCAIFPPMGLYLGGRTFLAFLATVVLAVIVGFSVAGWYSIPVVVLGYFVVGLVTLFYLEIHPKSR